MQPNTDALPLFSAPTVMAPSTPFLFDGVEVRVVVRDGEPLFLASAVAALLGYSDTDQAIRKHCKAARSCPVDWTGQVRHMNMIPERDVYRLVMRSRMPGAERFEEWVVGEVLPSIRKRGAYIAGQEKVATGEMTPAELMARALTAAQDTIRDAETEARPGASYALMPRFSSSSRRY